MAKFILDDVRKQQGLSKRALAKRMRMEYYAIFRYFRKGYDPKLSVLARFAKALKVKVRDLIRD